MSRADRRRLAKDDQKLILKGIDPADTGIDEISAIARTLHTLLERAKRSKSVAETMSFLYSNVGATLSHLKDVEIACGKGCSHCCHIWVSATAPEALYIASRIRRKANSTVQFRIADAHQNTKQFAFDERDKHPYPRPMLENNACSIYDIRPMTCRFAASGDAEICARSYHNVTDENIPTPFMYVAGSGAYALAMSCALKRAGFIPAAYSFNSALEIALTNHNAEEEWLKGVDVFASVSRDPHDPFASPQFQRMYDSVFGL